MQLLDELKEKRGYCKLKEEALERTYWRTRFGGGYGSVVRLGNERTGERTSKRVNELVNIISVLDRVASVEGSSFSHVY
jgi:hypothetical protein